MSARLAARIAVATLIVVALHSLSAQVPPPSMPAGNHQYTVRGFFQGEEMDAWTSEFVAGDTAFGSEPGVRIVYRSHQSGGGYLYSYSAAWSRISPIMRVEWINSGQMSVSCSLVLEHGELRGKLDNGSSVAAARVGSDAVPDFAIGAHLASRTLAAGPCLIVAAAFEAIETAGGTDEN
jgi:hypothetical protein